MSVLFSLVLVAAASVTQVSASCAYGTHLSPRAEGGAVEIKTFGYSGAIGPLSWSSLDGGAANVLCSTGTRQSPIDMVEGSFHMMPASDLKLEIADMPEGTEFENLGTTVEVVAKGGALEVGGKTYELQQFHFHLPSEHLDNGTSIAMEMHMVWQTPAEEIAVIGVFVDLDRGTEAATAAPVVEKVRRQNHPHSRRQEPEAAPDGSFGGVSGFVTSPMVTQASISSNVLETVFSQVEEIAIPGTVVKTQPLVMSEIVNALLAGSFQSYSGSLTTPPCSESVLWLVATQKLQINVATFERVRSVIGFNSRYPQNNLGEPNLLAAAAASVATQQVAQANVAGLVA